MEQPIFNYLFDSSDSDEDLDFVGNVVTKNEDYLEETVRRYSEDEFFEHFRVSRNVAEQISEKFQNSDFYKNQSGQFGKISAYNKVIIFLWFIGHQTASFTDIADRFHISKSSLERIIKKVAVFLSNLSPTVITWPDAEEKRQIEEDFRANGFPNVIGAIDGCHIKIDRPEQDPDSYINRKGYHSIQMQVVCDKNCQIRDIFIGYPGSVHDSRVFRNSPLFLSLPEKCGQFFLLGDSGYPLQNNLLTPFKDRGQLTNRQVNYNLQLAKNRYIIEHCFGIIKQKFRQLYHLKLRKMDYIVHTIRAACVLHNLALADEFVENVDAFDINNPLLNVNEELDQEEDIEEDRNAQRIRDDVVNVL